MKGGDLLSVLAAGLPNITGKSEGCYRVNEYSDGAFYYVRESNSSLSGNTLLMQIFGFDASRSNAIYGSSDTVQPPALSLIPQLKF